MILDVLDFSFNQLTGTVDISIGNMQYLHHLFLQSNNFYGEFPSMSNMWSCNISLNAFNPILTSECAEGFESRTTGTTGTTATTSTGTTATTSTGTSGTTSTGTTGTTGTTYLSTTGTSATTATTATTGLETTSGADLTTGSELSSGSKFMPLISFLCFTLLFCLHCS